MPSSVSFQTEWKKEMLPVDVCLSSSEAENKPETDGLFFKDPPPKDIVDFPSIDTLLCSAHSPNHKKTKQFESGTCRKTSSKTGHVMLHAPSRELNARHQCHACCKTFPSLSKLQRHMLTHTGQRPFGCQMCGKRFRQKTHLRVHCRTHLWSKYHKQRSLYISRPLSRTPRFNTRLTALPNQEVFVYSNSFENYSSIDLLSEKQLDEAPSLPSVQNDTTVGNSLSTSQKNEVVRLTKVSKVTVRGRWTVRNPSDTQHKCFQCFKCFPSNLVCHKCDGDTCCKHNT
uniref:C2H2-type domain-containing protein n=1 Tax=Myripristis murdjan TaxID=586833 RepID=A0A667ZA75_9TELE